MEKTINFAEETYNLLKKSFAAKDKNLRIDYLGSIKQGAVCCDLNLLEDEGFNGEDYCYNGKYVIDAEYYLLGKDGGYGKYKGIPYDCISGFYGYLKDTYEETIAGLSQQFDDYMDNEELKTGIQRTDLTWDKVEAYEGNIYPDYKG